MRLDDAVDALAFASGAVVAMPVDGAIVCASAADGAVAATLPGHAGGNLGLAISPDGRRLASVGQDGQLRCADPDGGAAARTMAGLGWIDHVAWGAGGLATACRRSVTLWDADLGRRGHHDGFPSAIGGLAFAPGGGALAASHYGGATLIDADGGRRLRPWKGSQLRLAWSADGRWLAAATQDRAMHLWRMPDGDECQMEGFPGKLAALAWHPSRPLLASASGCLAPIWDCAAPGPEGRGPQRIDGHMADIAALAWHPRRDLIACGDRDGAVGLWAPGGRNAIAWHMADAPVSALAWDAAGGLLAIGCADGACIVCAAAG